MVSSRLMRVGGLEDGCSKRIEVQEGRPRGAERHAGGMWVLMVSVDKLRVWVYETSSVCVWGVEVR